MKLILAIIRPEKLAAVQAVLGRNDDLITVSEVLGYGREQGHVEIYRCRTVRRPVTKVRVEVDVSESVSGAAVDAILGAVRGGDSGQVCYDKVYVVGLDEYTRAQPQHERFGVGTIR
jgi:nitrogen regulatory protein PII